MADEAAFLSPQTSRKRPAGIGQLSTTFLSPRPQLNKGTCTGHREAIAVGLVGYLFVAPASKCPTSRLVYAQRAYQ
ncbi:hypothetical protein CCM_04788 [Cordyceps militaris CM01]|uniref:Uncharacterized protein n=1 Tax=Cordyceps militaris (strain CM01) TaxID=983644 RepID=G3JEL7_CORMM|nr:uncharacterized protein CCM_04788 [Cordyceps militaris CM01]EGX93414.1 hypothetical protein CCM_04788 [Cordyceps militaris CM01]